MKKFVVICTVMLAPLVAMSAFAAQLKVFVADINAVGAANKDELKTTLQTLLASRLNNDQIMSVASASEADVIVTGTYVAIGKVFSVDALAKTVAGKSVTRAFVQGESQDELIPSIGQLADKLSAGLSRQYFPGSSAAPSPAALPAPSSPKKDIIMVEQVRPAATAEFIKPREYEQGSTSGWTSKRLIGAANLLTLGAPLQDGGRQIFMAEDRRISYYRQSHEMKLITDVELGSSEKIVSLDAMVTGNNTELYVSVMRGAEVSSQVWQVQGDKLVRLTDKIPYFFRVFSLAGAPRKLYAQGMGRGSDFYGDVFEAALSGNSVSLKNPIKMPRFGNIYTFNQFTDAAGTVFTTAINPDNYLIVYDRNQAELWRSNDKFGGSELYFQKEDPDNVRVTGDNFRWIFMNQRIQVTSKGEVLVGKNDGFWVLGNARSYKKGAVYCLTWNGSSMEEKWRTRETQNYMPDYFFDEASNELLILQTVQRPGITNRGASSLAIKKVE
ncbi:MAG: VCBS repeat-containing protein [Steroidobacteraceae bacterium]|nr:VCBS repeat-containing protein [Deltaproteobacteria bacterium]